MKLPFWLCDRLGHKWRWSDHHYNDKWESVGLKRCERCPATLRVKGSDWRTW